MLIAHRATALWSNGGLNCFGVSFLTVFVYRDIQADYGEFQTLEINVCMLVFNYKRTLWIIFNCPRTRVRSD